MANKQVNNNAQGLFGTEQQDAQNAYGSLFPGYENMLANPGYTSQQQTAITGATEGGIGAAFGSSAEGAANRAARTNNTAGLTASQDALARQRMITAGQAGAQNQVTFANDAQKQQEQALQGLQGIYGTGVQGANSTLKTQEENNAHPGFWGQLGGAFAGAFGKGLGAGLVPG